MHRPRVCKELVETRSEPSLCLILTHHCWPNNLRHYFYCIFHRPPSYEPLLPPKGVRAWSVTTSSNYSTLWGDSMTKRPVRFTTMTQSQSVLLYPNFWWSCRSRGLIAGEIWQASGLCSCFVRICWVGGERMTEAVWMGVHHHSRNPVLASGGGRFFSWGKKLIKTFRYNYGLTMVSID